MNWISVKDKLPEREGDYLCAIKISERLSIREVCEFVLDLHEFDKYDFPHEKRPGFYDCLDGKYFEVKNITHWMPLPSLPERETEK